MEFNFLFLKQLNSKLVIISNQTKLNLNLHKMAMGRRYVNCAIGYRSRSYDICVSQTKQGQKKT